MFKAYQHIERLGLPEVRGIEYGECYIFPKIDGTNSSVWIENGSVNAGSRRRHLTDDVPDNAGFREWAQSSNVIKKYLEDNPTHRLFGEWLVPHTIKTYREDAWRKFYVFDILVNDESYIPFPEYAPELKSYNIDLIEPMFKITNPTVERLYSALEVNDFLVKDGEGVGEGIILKNYSFRNRYGRTTWAKIVRTEFKEKNKSNFGYPDKKEKKSSEESIAEEYVTISLVNKVYANICNEVEFTSKLIPRLLNTVYYDLIREESWQFVKKYKNPVIDFKRLMGLTFAKVKTIKPELF